MIHKIYPWLLVFLVGCSSCSKDPPAATGPTPQPKPTTTTSSAPEPTPTITWYNSSDPDFLAKVEEEEACFVLWFTSQKEKMNQFFLKTLQDPRITSWINKKALAAKYSGSNQQRLQDFRVGFDQSSLWVYPKDSDSIPLIFDPFDASGEPKLSLEEARQELWKGLSSPALSACQK